jgi:hypothetical protein
LPIPDDAGRSLHGRRTAFPPGFEGSCEAALERVSAEHGVRATVKGQPIDPASVTRYLRQKFGPALAEVQSAMEALTQAYSPDTLAAQAYALYEQFRPDIPEGQKGWGAAGHLDLDAIRALAD